MSEQNKTFDPMTMELEAWPLEDDQIVAEAPEVEGGPTLEVGPGSVGLLHAGDRTIWRVHETLRKVFQATNP